MLSDPQIAYIQEHWTDEKGVLSADKMQKDLSRIFQTMLLFRETTVEDVVEDFSGRFAHWLEWLGTIRQDEILREAQESLQIDLSKWLEER